MYKRQVIFLMIWWSLLSWDFWVWLGVTLFMIACLLYTSGAADDLLCVDLGGRRVIKKKINTNYMHSDTVIMMWTPISVILMHQPTADRQHILILKP